MSNKLQNLYNQFDGSLKNIQDILKNNLQNIVKLNTNINSKQ